MIENNVAMIPSDTITQKDEKGINSFGNPRVKNKRGGIWYDSNYTKKDE